MHEALSIGSKSHLALAQERRAELRRRASLAEELSQREADFKDNVSLRRKEILKNKRLALFGRSDNTLVEDLINGFALTGKLPKFGVPSPCQDFVRQFWQN